MIEFTVITCTFNAEHELQRTLDSVMEQTYPYVEHLIIDGLSKDRTVEMARNYMERDAAVDNGHRVEVVSEKDSGLYDAMNKGIRKSTGDYLVFMNAGDVFPSPETLWRVAHNLVDGEMLPGVLYGNADIVNDEGHFIRHRRLQPPENLSWKSFRQGMVVCHQSFYARADLAKANPYNLEYRYSADVDWCIRIMKAAEEKGLMLKNVGEVLVNYLDGGMTVKNHRASLKERFRVMVSHYGLFSTVALHFWFVVRAVVKR
ncbi:MAG: glycosyltransferase family 2 protein [Prevotella sp.]|jgi:glycosyltransferase involved in cell wall biosynthesis